MKRSYRIQPGTCFGRWTVTGLPSNPAPGPGRHVYWPCRCDCGTVREVRSSLLIRGESLSCGCRSAELTVDRQTRHGMFGTRLYHTWSSMKRRCYRSDHPGFHWYGGRGITVCQSWQRFEPFMLWALNSGYADTLEIDRIDSNGQYSPENCRWVTDQQQSRNKRNTIYMEAFGERKPLAEWVEDSRSAVRYGTLYGRWVRGWRDETAITTPSRNQAVGRDRR